MQAQTMPCETCCLEGITPDDHRPICWSRPNTAGQESAFFAREVEIIGPAMEGFLPICCHISLSNAKKKAEGGPHA